MVSFFRRLAQEHWHMTLGPPFELHSPRDYPDDLPVPSFGPRLRCERCGHLSADARPNWNERAPVNLFGSPAQNRKSAAS